MKDGFKCFFFHDVDLIHESDDILYECMENPRHYSAWINKWKYLAPYENIFGGITAFTKDAFQFINGYSNEYWGWGGEDDDMFRRVHASNLTIKRDSPEIAR